jgi:hypothetical protein
MSKPNFRLSKRMVSARFWANPELSKLAKQSRICNLKLTMIGLWAFADESGIFEWQPEIAASMLYALDAEEDRAAVEPAMNAMLEAGFLKKIELNGTWYGMWPKWGEHNKFRKNDSRYPEVAAALGYPVEAGTPREGENTPLEDKDEGEGGSTLSKCLPEQETPKQGEQDNPEAGRLANLLFKLLDQPREHVKNAGVWEQQISSLLRTHKEDEIAAVMQFAVKHNEFSAEYLTLAKEPMKSFVKNYDNLHKRWKALQKGAAAAASRAGKLQQPKDSKPLPGAHGNKSGYTL